MYFQPFSRNTTYVGIPVKLSEVHFDVSLFSNPGDKVLVLVESTGHICPIVFLLLKTLSLGLKNNDTVKCNSDNFPGMLTHVVFLESCQNYTSMYHCYPIQGTIS